ncbi:O-antigen ligase family protein [Maribacter sp. HTCC2170]|uniref:O-antigen ligase family protein n=1 Tax=Maribacter sp. (strain HTCC2170 / KCCM 42371) TaxID=313603 RepID=UPI001305379A|nr:O-antigen ligase family protein [Maribacter sp. HTCC2170]
MILVVCAPEVLKRTKHRDIFYLALVGAFSVVVNAMVFPESNMIHGLVIGRYSGFYLNPNSAGTVCLIGFALSYSIKSIKWRYMGQFAFTLAGLLTLSRTFIVVWLLINIFAIYRQKRNVWVPFIGAAVLVLVLTFTDRTIFAADRFEALSSFFDEGPVKTKTIKHDSRTATWAQYYPLISEKPLLGHGFGSFQTKENNLPGAHNGFLLVIGEAGIIPFFLFLGVYIYLLVCSLKIFKQYPEILYMCLVLILALMASHTYFTSYFIVFMSMYLYIKLRHYRVPHT